MAQSDDQETSRLFQQALALHQSGALAEAEELYRVVLARSPGHVAALANRGAALRNLARPADALQSYDQALDRRPDHAPTWNNRGVALVDLGRHDEALEAFERALFFRPGYPEALNNKGRALAALGQAAGREDPRAEQALAAFDRAIAQNPAYAEAHDNRGLLLFELGRFDEAIQAVEQAIRLSPGAARFYYHLAELGGLGPGDPRIEALEAVAAARDASPPSDPMLAHFALGAVRDRTGDAAAAFEHWRQGNALRRAQVAYDEPAALAWLDAVRAAFPAEAIHPVRGARPGGPTPVFIVGMPRSGSTLVEQILASHPDVHAVGEADAFRRALWSMGYERPDRTAAMSPQELAELGASYLRAVTPPGGVRCVVDKRLDNFVLAGVILNALPGARIVHVRRDPRDACLSAFSKLFGEELAYTFDLEELGRYWRAYDGLMSHWRRVLPPETLLEVDYEALVQDLEGQTRRLLAHCGLPWDRRSLDFHLTPRRIPTASATQVRRALYQDAVGRWRAYEPWLGPLLEALAD